MYVGRSCHSMSTLKLQGVFSSTVLISISLHMIDNFDYWFCLLFVSYFLSYFFFTFSCMHFTSKLRRENVVNQSLDFGMLWKKQNGNFTCKAVIFEWNARPEETKILKSSTDACNMARTGLYPWIRIEQEKLLACQEYLCVLDDFTFFLSPTLEIFLWGIDKSMLGFSKQFVGIVFVFLMLVFVWLDVW